MWLQVLFFGRSGVLAGVVVGVVFDVLVAVAVGLVMIVDDCVTSSIRQTLSEEIAMFCALSLSRSWQNTTVRTSISCRSRGYSVLSKTNESKLESTNVIDS